MGPMLLLLVLGGALLVHAIRRYRAGRYLRKIRGPPSPSRLMGHTELRRGQFEVGALDKQYMQEYGTAWRLKTCLSEDVLELCDPKALQYIYQKSGYNFAKPATSRQLIREVTGSGILYAMGQDHARIRKIMNPAFASTQIRSFVPLFRNSAQKLGQKWKDLLQTSPDASQRINVMPWMSRCTLDIIGEVGFDVQCGALDDALNPVLQAYKGMFTDTIPVPTEFVKYIPTKEHIRFRRTLNIINNFARELIAQRTAAALAGKNENKKDILSILVRANASEDPKSRLSDEEMISQVATFLLAGHETTALTMNWMLYEISRHPEYQAKMRDEVKALRARVAARGDSDFSLSDLESMTHVQAAMKEVLRLHPIVYAQSREATRDDVIPLATPAKTTTGELVDEIPIPKGTTCSISIWGYNRLPQIWGADADEFNPGRWTEQDKLGQSYVGVTSNLMTFVAGAQSCIGWRFSMIEMQVILVELLEQFEFAVPEDKPEIYRFAAGLVAPFVKSDMRAGPQMPIQVSLIQ
ncbi:hypothetical protein NUW54_g2300 [Trametes sanguinea]|uniref:Uncharacterized protein n=1 Tax=Trametes sanguinea TaxID=158606 RepID=A0ACC1Q5B0_9APHY|nr:hypothetical protein NUW54_g2300 [Trametes sanguinea]